MSTYIVSGILNMTGLGHALSFISSQFILPIVNPLDVLISITSGIVSHRARTENPHSTPLPSHACRHTRVSSFETTSDLKSNDPNVGVCGLRAALWMQKDPNRPRTAKTESRVSTILREGSRLSG